MTQAAIQELEQNAGKGTLVRQVISNAGPFTGDGVSFFVQSATEKGFVLEGKNGNKMNMNRETVLDPYWRTVKEAEEDNVLIL